MMQPITTITATAKLLAAVDAREPYQLAIEAIAPPLFAPQCWLDSSHCGCPPWPHALDECCEPCRQAYEAWAA